MRQIVMRCSRERGSIFITRVAQHRKASDGGHREPGVSKHAESGVNSNDNCGVKGSRVGHGDGEFSLSVFLSRREDRAEERKVKLTLSESRNVLSAELSTFRKHGGKHGDPSCLT